MKKMEMGKTEQAVLKFLKSYINEHGYAPSYQEISDATGKCKSYVYTVMKTLMSLGEIETDYKDSWHSPRSYRIKREPKKVYVVVTDEYDEPFGAEYHLRGVFTDEKKAKRIAKDKIVVVEADLDAKCNVYVGGYIE